MLYSKIPPGNSWHQSPGVNFLPSKPAHFFLVRGAGKGVGLIVKSYLRVHAAAI